MYKKGDKLVYLGNNPVTVLYFNTPVSVRDFGERQWSIPKVGEICFVTIEDNKRLQVQFPEHLDMDWNGPQGRALIYIENLAPWIEQLLL